MDALARWGLLAAVVETAMGRPDGPGVGADRSRPWIAPRADAKHAGSEAGEREVRVYAPETARSVNVTLPSGETRLARFDAGRGFWSTRFFLDSAAPDSRHDVWVRVSHAGRVEVLRLVYVASRSTPVVTVALRPVDREPDSLEITATEVVAATATSTAGLVASIAESTRHVEVRMPDGRLAILGELQDGVFHGYWTPSRRISGPVRLRVVAVDRGLHERVSEVTLDPRDIRVAAGH
jgi:hypothetical protein